MKALLFAVALAALIAPGAQAQDEKFIPGYTDFPNHLRVESIYDDEQGGTEAIGFTPGYSDFPNHLRFDSEYDRARYQSGFYGGVITVRRESPGFDWSDAGIGAGGAAAVLLLGSGLAALALRRPIRRAALTG